MKPTITAFAASPDRGRGLARDMRARWALEEVGQPYDVRLLSFAEMKQPDHLSRQPFGQIPTYEDGEVTLFESGAIVLRIAETYPGLLPEDPAARSRAINWMFASVGTIEPIATEIEIAKLLEGDKEYAPERIKSIKERLSVRLTALTGRLGDAEWIDSAFSAGDLMLIEVLERFKAAGNLEDFPTLCAYVDRGKARPAFQRAFEDQRQVFLDSQQDAGVRN